MRRHLVFLIVTITTLFIAFFTFGQASLKDNSTQKKEVPEWIYPAPFKYDAKNLPDPFVPFVKIKKEGSITKKRQVKSLGPLQKIDPTQLKLIGITYSKNRKIQPMALVELPDKKAYVLEIGTYVGQNGGYVKNISKDKVTIVEPTFNIFGEKSYKEIILKLHKKEGE
ncbi:hypothetical protein JCM12298_26150 [Desulfothermus naphthae]